MSLARRIALVAPRFGTTIIGGAEAVIREIALGLADRGWAVDVLTTCAVSEYTWANELPAGSHSHPGVRVLRFPTVPTDSPAGANALEAIHAGDMPGLGEQAAALMTPFRVPELFRHLLYHGNDYPQIVFSPYLFWTTTACLPLVAERAVLIPCLHDEPFAWLEVVRPLLSLPAACWFLSEPEHQLAHRLGPVAERHLVTGAGVEVPGSYDEAGFRRRHGLRRPFALFAGRREETKGWPWLLERFGSALTIDDPGVDLVTIGAGPADIPPDLRDRVVDLGAVSETDRNDAMAAASVYVQPSLMESFSRAMMEAWLAGTPVLCREGCEVARWHIERSRGGGRFADAADLAAALRALTADPASAAAMGARGRRYVLANYTWPRVLDGIVAELEGLAGLAPFSDRG